MLGKKNPIDKKKLVLFAYLGILSSIGILILLFTSQGEQILSQAKAQQKNHSQGWLDKSDREIHKRISSGDRILIGADNSPDKQAASKAFADQDYQKASELFSDSLRLNRNDPETWIYLNNATAAVRGETVTIAAVVPIGRNLNVAKEILRGVAQAQNELNRKGGIDGKLIQIKIANDENDPEIAKKIATEFVKDKKVLAIIGHNASEATIAAAPIYQEGKVVVISPTSGAREISDLGSYIFRTTPSFRVTAETLAQYTVKSANKSKIAICADSTDKGSISFKEEFAWTAMAVGAQITATACDFSKADFNASEIPSQAISDGADALLVVPSVNKINQAIEIVQANKHRLAMFGNQSMYTYETLKQGQIDINGMVFAVAWHPQVNQDRTFVTNTKKFWGGEGSWRTATAYDATSVAIAGLKAGQKRDTLQKTLSNPGFSFKGATGEIRFLSSGDRFGAGVLVKIQPGKNSGTGYDFAAIQPVKKGKS
jgi:branched-chain amino acid transport system substrate-binding protein